MVCFGGWNPDGEHGTGQMGEISWPPVEVSGLSGLVSVAAGNNHSCAVNAQGSVSCWGNNLAGQLGDGTTTGSPTPVDVTGL